MTLLHFHSLSANLLSFVSQSAFLYCSRCPASVGWLGTKGLQGIERRLHVADLEGDEEEVCSGTSLVVGHTL